MKSDSDLQHDVRDELARLCGSGADEIDVLVLKGVVTLTGKVGGDWEKWGVEGAVRRMPGVKGLHDQTMVVPADTAREPSADVARGWFP